MKTNLMHSLLLDIAKTSTNKDIKDVVKNISKDMPLEQVLKNKDIQNILKDLLSDLVKGNKTSKSVLNILKNETVFKEFKSFSSELKTFFKLLPKNDIKNSSIESIKKVMIDVKSIDDKILKSNISKSGVFLESYLKNLSTSLNDIDKQNIKQNILEDIKTILLKTNEEYPNDKELQKQSNKLLTQIDYYQLLSSSGYSNHTYLPFYWDDLENGDINFKQKDEENFTCHISLQLKYYGDVKINMIFLKPDKLSISFFVQEKKLKEKIQNNLQNLRKSLKNINIDLNLLNILDLKQNDKLSKQIQTYTKYNDNFTVDIKV